MNANHAADETARRRLDRALDQLAGDPDLAARTARRVLERADGAKTARYAPGAAPVLRRIYRSPFAYAAAALVLLLAGLAYVAGPNYSGDSPGEVYAGLSAPGAQYIASEDSTAYYWEETDAIIASAGYGD